MHDNALPRKLWEHADPTSTQMFAFMQEVNSRNNIKLTASRTFHDLFDWSTSYRTKFWELAFEWFNIIHAGSYHEVVSEEARMDSIPRWFEGITLNYAENILYRRSADSPSGHRGTVGKEDNKIVATSVREGNKNVQHLTWGELRRRVFELGSAMRQHGVKKGDRIAAVASNSFDTLIVHLAATSIGAIYSSSSTDMGTAGILQRLVQIKPRFLFMDDVAVYNGKTVDLREKMLHIVDGMKDVEEFDRLVVIPRFSYLVNLANVPRAVRFEHFLSKSVSSQPFFERCEFAHPNVIYYSSGTTGMPKCIVHSTGGTMLSSFKEGLLHGNLGPESVVLQYTTTGWIMYLATIMNLLLGCRVILYDGSPFIPDSTILLRIIEEQRVTKLGVSPRWMQEQQKRGVIPKSVADLSSLQQVSSTGMVLSNQLYEWFYDEAFPPSVQLCNISGGTDIAGCFGMENPLTPVFVGGIQGGSLGTPVAIFDSSIEGGPGVSGQPVAHGTPGELVSPRAFPNMPVKFWNDALGARYHDAYFAKYDNVWVQGDYAVIHPVTRNIAFLGRADGVLNPSGIRFGSAEIYSVLEKDFSMLQDSICVGQRRPQDADESVMLFCLMKPGHSLTPALVDRIKSAIKTALSARHVPKYVFQTPEIPVSTNSRGTLTSETTINLKKVELPVKKIVSGQVVTPSGTLLNPQSLEFYYQFANVEGVVASKSKL